MATKPRLRRPPKADAAIYDALSALFRKGDLYAFTYEGGVWSTWETEHDWAATERNNCFRCYCVPRSSCDAHGPTDWDRADLVAWLEIEPSPKPARRSKVVAPASAEPETILPPMSLSTVDDDLSRRLRNAGNKVSEWTAERDRLIREAVAAGGSLREVGKAAGLSHTQIRNVVHGRP